MNRNSWSDPGRTVLPVVLGAAILVVLILWVAPMPATLATDTSSGTSAEQSFTYAATAAVSPTSQIHSPNKDAVIIQKDSLTISGFAWGAGIEPPFLVGDPFLTAERTTDRAYLLSWTSVVSASYYLVEEETDPQFSDPQPVSACSGSGTDCLVTKNDDGTYYYRVKADAPGIEPSRYSNVVSVVIPWTVGSTPPSASAPSADIVANSLITVEVSIDGEEPWNIVTAVTSTSWGGWEWSYVWSLSEERDVQHTIQTRARGAGDDVGPTDTITVTVSNKYYIMYFPIFFKRWPPMPYAPTLLAIDNPSGEDSYTVNWSYDDGDPAVPDPGAYTLQEATNADFTGATDYYPIYGTSYPFSDKDEGTYYYRVRGHNIWGPGQWSNTQATTVVSSDYYDDFSNAGSGWPTHQAACCLIGCDNAREHLNYKYNLYYEGGRYHVNVPLDCRAAGGGSEHGDTRHIYPVTLAPGVERPTSRTCIGMRGSFEHWDPYWSFWGLVFAASDDLSTVYSLEVNNLGAWGIQKRTGYQYPGPNHPNLYETRTAIKVYGVGREWPAYSGFTPNSLKVEVTGQQVKLYINGKEAYSFSDSAIPSLRRVGIIGGDWEIAPTQIGYDYFFVDEGCDDY